MLCSFVPPDYKIQVVYTKASKTETSDMCQSIFWQWKMTKWGKYMLLVMREGAVSEFIWAIHLRGRLLIVCYQYSRSGIRHHHPDSSFLQSLWQDGSMSHDYEPQNTMWPWNPVTEYHKNTVDLSFHGTHLWRGSVYQEPHVQNSFRRVHVFSRQILQTLNKCMWKNQ